jgi:hypothetical protein
MNLNTISLRALVEGQQQSLLHQKISSPDTTNTGSDRGKNTTRGRQIGEEEERKRQAGCQRKEEDEEEERRTTRREDMEPG